MSEFPPDGYPRPQGLFGPLFEVLLRRMHVEVDAELGKHELRLLHLGVLNVLDAVGKQSQADLAEAVRVDKTTMVGLLNDLEAAGLVERQRSPLDRRRHDVVMTPLGRRRNAEMVEALRGAEGRVLSALSATQRCELFTLLEQAFVAADADAGVARS
ncbi:transcriptional regulator [Mycobacteroides abscessus subsp. abscessus]|uniref:MarR family winged helix-turn-helix transcriptional regulator n=1 Tax=Mycobacteroides abscessus TaxID=36809 RepID=UPI00092B7F36|nr:MarR family winged helix-turn-helix transcriptional regulator [Mycobacteroides abscessus]SHQ68531.1 transcriptional regulator [Mycobacteroides abscessus subsp. abscessus]SHS06949.1 transcriptional regulator [Mycobacteroides abscessus subsp. abscessus]SHS25198.1 transcriptional regulator [Mycobacteroides abscessus subsp. abscessus]SKD53393.1 transcriptional regulator [Mycobacteroides abscessus subsp. abscessus]SKH42372.1 transcriptional regulator [Mycobacteroides abscessus subsp. abscessus]